MAVVAADLIVRLGSETSGAEAGLNRVNAGIGRLGGAMKSVASTAGGFVLGSMIQNVAGSIGQLGSNAMTFERNMANVNSIMQGTQSEIAAVSQQVIDISSRTGQASTTLAAGLYDIYSSGFSGQEGLSILAVAANAATAGLTTTDVSAQAIAASLNAFGQDASDAGKNADILFQTVNDGVTTFELLGRNIGPVMPAAKALGLELADVGAGMAQLTLKGIGTSEAATGLTNVYKSALSPTAAMTEALAAQGEVSAENVIQTRGLAGYFGVLDKAMATGNYSAQDLLGSFEAVTTYLNLGEDGAKAYTAELEKMNRASDDGGATAKALAQQQKSLSFQLQRAQIAVQNLITKGFLKVSPALAKVAGGFANFLTTGVTPFLSYMGGMFSGFETMNGWLDRLPQPLRRFAHGFGVVAEAAGDMVRAFQAGGFAGLGDVIGRELRQAASGIAAMGAELLQGATWVANVVIDTAVDFVGWLFDNAENIWGGIKSLVGWGAGIFADTVRAVITGGIDLIGDIADAAGNLWGWIQNKLFGGVSPDGTSGPGQDQSISIGDVLVEAGLKLAETVLGGVANIGEWFRKELGLAGYAQNTETGAIEKIPLGTVFVNAGLKLGGDAAAWVGRLGAWVMSQLGIGGGSGNPAGAGSAFGGTGIGLPPVDLGDWIINVATPTLAGWITGAAGWLNTKIQEAVSGAIKIAARFGDWVVNVAVPTLTGWVTGAAGWLNTQIQAVVSGAVKVAARFGDWVIDTAVPTLTGWVTGAGAWLSTKIQSVVSGATTQAVRLSNWVIDIGIPTVSGWIDGASAWLSTKIQQVVSGATTQAVRLSNWVVDIGVPTAQGWIDGASAWLSTKLQGVVSGATTQAVRLSDWVIDVDAPAELQGWVNGASLDLSSDIAAKLDGLEVDLNNWVLKPGTPEVAFDKGVAVGKIAEKLVDLAVDLDAWKLALGGGVLITAPATIGTLIGQKLQGEVSVDNFTGWVLNVGVPGTIGVAVGAGFGDEVSALLLGLIIINDFTDWVLNVGIGLVEAGFGLVEGIGLLILGKLTSIKISDFTQWALLVGIAGLISVPMEAILSIKNRIVTEITDLIKVKDFTAWAIELGVPDVLTLVPGVVEALAALAKDKVMENIPFIGDGDSNSAPTDTSGQGQGAGTSAPGGFGFGPGVGGVNMSSALDFFGGGGKSNSQSIAPVVIPAPDISAVTSTVSQATTSINSLAALKPTASATLNVDAVFDGAASATSVMTMLEGMNPTPKATLNIDGVFDGAAQAISLLNQVGTMNPIPTVGLNVSPLFDGVAQSISLLNMLGAMYPIPTAGLNVSPLFDGAAQAISLLNQVGGMNPTPTVGVNDQASGVLYGVLGLLNSIDGRVAQATVTTTNITDNITRFSETGKYAKGGQIGQDIALVGERGPELLLGQQGKRVLAAGQTEDLFRAAGDDSGPKRVTYNTYHVKADFDTGADWNRFYAQKQRQQALAEARGR